MQFLVNAVFQVAVVVLLVTLFWLGHAIFARRRRQKPEPWARWLGLHLPPKVLRRLWLFPAVFAIAWLSVFIQQQLLADGFMTFAVNTPAYKVSRTAGLDLLLGAIAYPFITSALSEEIFFRGLIAKRMMKLLGFQWGNVIQTVIFLAPHVLILVFFAPDAGMLLYAVMIATIVPLSWVSGWLMERRDDGSIFTPWLLHSAANFGTLVYFWCFVPSVPN